MYHLIIKWNDGHTTTMKFGVKCLADELADRYAKNHSSNINNIIIEEVTRWLKN